MHTLKPLDTEAVLAAVQQTKAIITVEEHSVIGGLGSAVSEVVARTGMKEIKLRSLGIPDRFANTGSQECLREAYELTPQDIISVVQDMLARS
jgi:transketolase